MQQDTELPISSLSPSLLTDMAVRHRAVCQVPSPPTTVLVRCQLQACLLDGGRFAGRSVVMRAPIVRWSLRCSHSAFSQPASSGFPCRVIRRHLGAVLGQFLVKDGQPFVLAERWQQLNTNFSFFDTPPRGMEGQQTIPRNRHHGQKTLQR